MDYLKHLFDFRRLFQRKYLPHLNIYLFGMIALLCLAEWWHTGDSSYGYKAALGFLALILYSYALKRRQRNLDNASPVAAIPIKKKMTPLRKKGD